MATTQVDSLTIRKVPLIGQFKCLDPHPGRGQCPFNSDRVSACQFLEVVQDLAKIHRSFEGPSQDACERLRIRIPIDEVAAHAQARLAVGHLILEGWQEGEVVLKDHASAAVNQAIIS